VEPLVSICIPAYNAERFIVETLETALAQTYPNIEIIVSDDASTDNTVGLVQGYCSRGVQVIRQAHNLGMHANWNAAIRASSGKYILKLDADDLVDADHVAQQVKVFESHPEVVFAHCACRLIDVNGCFLGYERSLHGSFIRSGLDEWTRYVFGPRAVNIVMLRRRAYDQVCGYDERYRYSGDWAMHRSLLRIGSVFYNHNVLASYRIHNCGKAEIRRLQAYERLMHLSDMERNWPEEVPNKMDVLRRARRRFAVITLLGASKYRGTERTEILQLVPEYSQDFDIRLLTYFVHRGGAPALQAYFSVRNRLRLRVKTLLLAFPRHRRILKRTGTQRLGQG
jgi:glycosyltransferase involved in cell wall biosynthesis